MLFGISPSTLHPASSWWIPHWVHGMQLVSQMAQQCCWGPWHPQRSSWWELSSRGKWCSLMNVGTWSCHHKTAQESCWTFYCGTAVNWCCSEWQRCTACRLKNLFILDMEQKARSHLVWSLVIHSPAKQGSVQKEAMEHFTWHVSHWDPEHMDILKNRGLPLTCSPREMICAPIWFMSFLPTFAADRAGLPAPIRQSTLDQDRFHCEGATASVCISSRK